MFWGGVLTATNSGVSSVSLDTSALTSVAARGAVGILSAGPLDAGVAAGVVGELAVLDVDTVVVLDTLQVGDTHAVRAHDEPWRAHTLAAVLGEHEAAAGVADALVADEHEAELGGAADTHALVVGVVTGRAHALLALVQDEAAAGRAGGYWCALHGGVALVARDADADHGAHGLGVQHRALRVAAARVRQVAGLHALLVDAGQLAGTLRVRTAADLHPGAAGALAALKPGRTLAVGLVTHHSALRHAHAGVLDGAGGDAVVVVTRLIAGTVSVRSAVYLAAGHEGVTLQTRGAAAGRLVADGLAHSLAPAWSIAGAADRAALLVAAGVGVETVVIHAALHLDTRHVRVTLVPLLARAHWVVVYHATEGVVAARARVLADLVDAGVSLAALIVRGAARGDGGEGLAAVILAGHEAVRAAADHRPDRQRVYDRAGGGLLAGAEGGAQQPAGVVEAGVLAGAVLVLDTLGGGDGDTRHPGVACVADGAPALGLVLAHQALGIRGAGVLVDAGIDAVLVPTSAVCRALGVSAAADNLAAHEGVSLIPRQAAAVGTVAAWVALGVAAAGVLQQARVDAVSLDAGLAVPAVPVTLAADGLAGDLRVAHVAGRADAHWAVVLHEALGAGAAVARVLALPVDTRLAVGTVVIPGAAGWVGQLHGLAAGVRLWHPALAAAADHGAEGEAVHHGADRGHVAGGQRVARVGAALVQARRVVRTVSVSIALGLRVYRLRRWLGAAGHQRVAHPARGTRALGHVVLDRAGGGGGTGVLVEAGVGTLVVDACRGLGAVLVDAALHTDAVGVGVTLQPGRAAAGGLVVGGVALGVGGAGVVIDAGVKTLPVSTDLGDGTLGVGGAAHCTNKRR